MKKLIALLLVLCTVLALTACGSKPSVAWGTPASPTEAPDADLFVISACIASEPESLDPTMTSSVDSNVYVNYLFEGLLRYGSTGRPMGSDPNMTAAELELGQAKSYTVSEDGLIYTFTLRDDIYWSDGQPVRAQDFVYSWRRLCDPAQNADYGYLPANVNISGAEAVNARGAAAETLGVLALDDKTLQITLTAATPFFLQVCASGCLVPLRQDVIEAYGKDWATPGHMVCNGPFMLREWEHYSYLSMEPNERYYDRGRVGPDRINWYLSDDEQAILAAFQSGEYDFVKDFPAEELGTLITGGDCYILPTVSTYYLYMNCDSLTDWRVRAAITLSIDRENIVENITRGGELPATSLVSQGITDSTGALWQNSTGYREVLWAGLAALYPQADLSTYEGRCALARELLDAAVADGFDAAAVIPYRFNNLGTHGEVAVAVQQDVSGVLGLNMVLDSVEWQVYNNTLEADRSWNICRFGWQADYLDASTYLDLLKTGSAYNSAHWYSADYDALCERYKTLPDGPERDAVMYAAEELLFTLDGFCVCPLFYNTAHYCLSRSVKNVCTSAMGYYGFTEAARG